MPGNRFEPTLLPTDKLMELIHQLNQEVNELVDDYHRRRDHWDTLIGRNAPQGAINIARQALKNCKTAETKARNKRTKVIQELSTRHIEELRALRTEIDEKKYLKARLDWEITKREEAGEE